MAENEQDKDVIIAQLREENRLLKEKVDYLIRVIHGAKSEKVDPAQLLLVLDAESSKKPIAADGHQNPPVAELEATQPAKKYRPRKPRLPEDIVTIETTLIPDEVRAKPEAYRQVGEKRSEKLDVTPTRYTRHITIRPSFVEKNEPIPRWISAPASPCLLEGSILTSSLLAHVLTQKFCDHLPFDRQEKIMHRRHGIHIPRNTLCNWADFAANELEPLYKLIARDLLSSDQINVDETPVDYLPLEGGSAKQGYFWVYYSRTAGVLYDWHTGRGNQCLDNILTGIKPDGAKTHFKGLLQCDGYKAYDTWANTHQGVNLAGCWAHARRKFHEALPHSQQAARILQLIQKLYSQDELYRQWIRRAHYPPRAIIYLRRRHSKSLLRQIHAEILALQAQHLPKTQMGKAISYALNQWRKLSLAAKHCQTLDNNVSENAVRPLKLGAKNWLFIGNENTGWRSAVIFTLIENIRREGHDPYAYLKWVFNQTPHLTNQHNLRALLPKAWLKLQQQKQKAPNSEAA